MISVVADFMMFVQKMYFFAEIEINATYFTQDFTKGST